MISILEVVEPEQGNMERKRNPRGAGRRPKNEEDRFSVQRSVLFTKTQAQRFDTWLRRNHPGAEPGPFLREMALRLIEHDPEGREGRGRVVIHLSAEDEKSITALMEHLGQKDLAMGIEEFMVRAANRDRDRVTRLFMNQPEIAALPVLEIAKLPTSDAPGGTPISFQDALVSSPEPSIGREVLSILQEMRAQGRVRFEGDPETEEASEDAGNGQEQRRIA